MQGFEERGSRPVKNAADCLYQLSEKTWFGFPDFACGVELTKEDLQLETLQRLQFLLRKHPNTPPQPKVRFLPESNISGIAFAPSEKWGSDTEGYGAQFGSLFVNSSQEVKIVKFNTATGEMVNFIKNAGSDEYLKNSAGGMGHPTDVVFGQDGSMYIVDFGKEYVFKDGVRLEKNSGVVWKLTVSNHSALGIREILYAVVSLCIAGAVLLYVGWGKQQLFDFSLGVQRGVISGISMLITSFVIAKYIPNLPWYVLTNVFAYPVMGKLAFANILELNTTPFVIGTLIILIITGLLGGLFTTLIRRPEKLRVIFCAICFALVWWILMQFLLFPLFSPLMKDLGFPAVWNFILFILYGLLLGVTLLLNNAVWKSINQKLFLHM
jgi:hypothetical protein